MQFLKRTHRIAKITSDLIRNLDFDRQLEAERDDDESVMMKLFLNSLLKSAMLGSRGWRELYTLEMAGVVVDKDE